MPRFKVQFDKYVLDPEQVLVDLCDLPCKYVLTTIKPLFGKGSGRAGGARSAVHKKEHTRRVGPGIRPEDCPICRYGMEAWVLWQDGRHGCSEAWDRYWECDPEERERFEMLASYCECLQHVDPLEGFSSHGE